MSAQLMVLPRIWACEDAALEQKAEAGPGLRLVAKPGLAEVFEAGKRKGPGSLRLVQAAAAEVAEEPIVLRRQAAAIGGVGYEFYRKYTEAMLRRYQKLSMEGGRVPSMLGRELFRGHVTSHKVQSFEDVSNFVLDMERCLGMLDPGQRHLVRRIAVEEYTQEETAAMLGMSLRTVIRRYREAVDRLTRVLLERKMMHPLSEV